MGKNPKTNSSTDCNKAETVGKISKIYARTTGTLIQQSRVFATCFPSSIPPTHYCYNLAYTYNILFATGARIRRMQPPPTHPPFFTIIVCIVFCRQSVCYIPRHITHMLILFLP